MSAASFFLRQAIRTLLGCGGQWSRLASFSVCCVLDPLRARDQGQKAVPLWDTARWNRPRISKELGLFNHVLSQSFLLILCPSEPFGLLCFRRWFRGYLLYLADFWWDCLDRWSVRRRSSSYAEQLKHEINFVIHLCIEWDLNPCRDFSCWQNTSCTLSILWLTFSQFHKSYTNCWDKQECWPYKFTFVKRKGFENRPSCFARRPVIAGDKIGQMWEISIVAYFKVLYHHLWEQSQTKEMESLSIKFLGLSSNIGASEYKELCRTFRQIC